MHVIPKRQGIMHMFIITQYPVDNIDKMEMKTHSGKEFYKI